MQYSFLRRGVELHQRMQTVTSLLHQVFIAYNPRGEPLKLVHLETGTEQMVQPQPTNQARAARPRPQGAVSSIQIFTFLARSSQEIEGNPAELPPIDVAIQHELGHTEQACSAWRVLVGCRTIIWFPIAFPFTWARTSHEKAVVDIQWTGCVYMDMLLESRARQCRTCSFKLAT